MRHAPFAFVVAALSLFVMVPAAAFSSTITYPGPAPCNSTLQACINAANAGDVVQTATVCRGTRCRASTGLRWNSLRHAFCPDFRAG